MPWVKNLNNTYPTPTGISRIIQGGLRVCLLAPLKGSYGGTASCRASDFQLECKTERRCTRKGCLLPHPILPTQIGSVRGDGDVAILKNPLVLSLLLWAALCKPLHKCWDDFKVKHTWVDGVPKGWEAI